MDGDTEEGRRRRSTNKETRPDPVPRDGSKEINQKPLKLRNLDTWRRTKGCCWRRQNRTNRGKPKNQRTLVFRSGGKGQKLVRV